MEDAVYIHIQCEGRLVALEKAMLETVGAVVGHANSVLGGETTVDILLIVAPLVLNNLTKIVMQLSRDRRKIRIKAPGFELTEIDSKTAKEIALRILDKLDHTPPPEI